jgi:hypothetical protein
VRLRVFDILGREIRTLVSGYVGTGSHAVVFDAGDLAGGVYAYRLEWNGTTMSRKFILLK